MDLLHLCAALGIIVLGGVVSGIHKQNEELGFSVTLTGAAWWGILVISASWPVTDPSWIGLIIKFVGWFSVCIVAVITGLFVSETVTTTIGFLRQRNVPTQPHED